MRCETIWRSIRWGTAFVNVTLHSCSPARADASPDYASVYQSERSHSEGRSQRLTMTRHGGRNVIDIWQPTRAVGAEETTTTIDDSTFTPAQITVRAGTKVTWVNNDDVPHTATSTAKPRSFDSRTLDTDGKFSHMFTTPGTYDYFCAVHPHMTGRIIVK